MAANLNPVKPGSNDELIKRILEILVIIYRKIFPLWSIPRTILGQHGKKNIIKKKPNLPGGIKIKIVAWAIIFALYLLQVKYWEDLMDDWGKP